MTTPTKAENPSAWWRLKPGLSGLKRIMPGRSIQWATDRGYGWPRHYEPICADCPALLAQRSKQP